MGRRFRRKTAQALAGVEILVRGRICPVKPDTWQAGRSGPIDSSILGNALHEQWLAVSCCRPT